MARKTAIGQGAGASGPTPTDPCAAEREYLMRAGSGDGWVRPRGKEAVVLRWQDGLLTIMSQRGSMAVFDFAPQDLLDCMDAGWLFEGQAHEGGPDDDVVRVSLRGHIRSSR